jgi:P pilus assembly chaperone PapD
VNLKKNRVFSRKSQAESGSGSIKMIKFEEKKSNVMKFTERMTARILKFVSIVTLLFLSLSQSFAQGNLLITPRRVVFEGNKQSQELTLANTGSDTAKYTVSFVQYRMTENGGFEAIDQPDPGQLFADKYLRFFPRTVTLPPNGSQVIRMQYKKQPDMLNAEYRSHVYFRAVPEEKPLGADEVAADTLAIGVRLVPIFGISIPVIIRNGDLDAEVELSNLNLDAHSDTIPHLSLTINRSGGKSVYGDIVVTYVTEQGESIEASIVRGVAVYTPNKLRNFTMDLQKLPSIVYNKGKLVVKFQAQNDSKAEVFAQKELILTN